MKLNQELTDEELIRKIADGKAMSPPIAQLYRQHYGMLEHYILKNSGTAADAADQIQEVMLVFVQLVSAGKFRGDAKISTVLFSICRNLWITELRKRKSTLIRNEKYMEEQEHITRYIDEQLEQQESLRVVMELFASLGKTCKTILSLFYYEELSMKEICKKLDFSSEQVLRNKKYKCLQNLTGQVRSSPAIKHLLLKALRHE